LWAIDKNPILPFPSDIKFLDNLIRHKVHVTWCRVIQLWILDCGFWNYGMK